MREVVEGRPHSPGELSWFFVFLTSNILHSFSHAMYELCVLVCVFL